MKYRSIAVMTFLGLMGASLAQNTHAGPTSPELAPAEKIDACVAQVSANVDVSDATRVRHEVASTKRRGVGHRLTVSTTVYGEPGGEILRAYAAECVVTNGKQPLVFRIEETAPDA